MYSNNSPIKSYIQYTRNKKKQTRRLGPLPTTCSATGPRDSESSPRVAAIGEEKDLRISPKSLAQIANDMHIKQSAQGQVEDSRTWFLLAERERTAESRSVESYSVLF